MGDPFLSKRFESTQSHSPEPEFIDSDYGSEEDDSDYVSNHSHSDVDDDEELKESIYETPKRDKATPKPKEKKVEYMTDIDIDGARVGDLMKPKDPFTHSAFVDAQEQLN